MSQDANTVLESSPESAEVQDSGIDLASLSSEQYDTWMLEGKLPEAKPETPPPSNKTVEAPDKSGEPKGNQEAGKGKGVKARTEQLDGEIQELEARLARKADLKRQLESEPGEKTGTPPAETKTAELKAPVKPRVEEFNTWDEYEAAKDEYAEKLTDYRVEVAIQEDRAQRAEEAKKQQQEAEARPHRERWTQQTKEAAEKYGAEEWNAAAKAVAPYLDPQQHPEFSAGSAFLWKSKAGADVTHYLGTHPDEAGAIYAMDGIDQVAELKAIEISLTKPAQSVKAPPGPKKVTEAPPPPSDLNGRNQLAPDPVRAALEADDTEAYMAAANAKDIADIAAGKRRR